MTTKRKPEAEVEPTLPVTPMLDMAFQLLAFFVMTYHPSDLEGQMDLSLPSENITKAKDQKDIKTDAKPDPKAPLELQADVTVIVRTQMDGVNDGRISSILLQDTAGQHPVDTLEKLSDELKERSKSVDNKENIKLQADAKLKWQQVVEVMDVCQAAGFKNISFVKPAGG